MSYENREGKEIDKVIIKISILVEAFGYISEKIYETCGVEVGDKVAGKMDELEYKLVSESKEYRDG